MTARYAIYFTLPADTPLGRFGATVLGYDCASGKEVPQAAIGDIAPDALMALTAEPRRYGFHATLVAPFRLGGGNEAALLAAAAAFAKEQPPAPLGKLAVTRLGSFIALCPAEKQPAIAVLESACVHAFHCFRAPLSAVERARRLKSQLTPHQIELMDRWGYPYVLDQYRFHMTLTGSLAAEQHEEIFARLTDAYAPLAGNTYAIDAISVLRQDDSAARFRVLDRISLTGRQGLHL
jgi:putative phosphonate metabolism protein